MATITQSPQPSSFSTGEPDSDLETLLSRSSDTPPINGIVVGHLVALTDDGKTPLLLFPGQSGRAAVPARSIVDLHGAHIGREVVLMFEGADPRKPIVMGILQAEGSSSLSPASEQVEVSADGERLVVTAKEQLVLRCGKASLTLTKAGKVLLRGTHVLSHSVGVNRVKGGAVHLN